MNKRWVIVDEEGNIIREVTPIGIPKFSHEPDPSIGLAARRRKLSTDLKFIGADHAYFLSIERRAARRCEEIIIRRDFRCDGKWKVFWTGTFSTGSGKWNVNPQHCSFTVRPEVLDRYTCLYRILSKKFNALSVGGVEAQAALVIPMEFFACWYDDFAGETACAAEAGNPALTGWNLVASSPNSGFIVNLYARRRERTVCIDGAPVPPPGSGWILLEDNCALNGTADYVRELTVDEIFDSNVTVVFGTCVDGVAIPPASGCAAYVQVTDCDEVDIDPAFACIGQSPIPLTGSRLLYDVLVAMIAECDGVTEVVSDLLDWNAIGDTEGYAPGISYMTGATNEMDGLVVVQKSDVQDPFADQPATIGYLTLREVLSMFANAPRILWAIDADGRMRFEHVSIWNTESAGALSSYGTVTGPLEYTHLKEEVPRYESLKVLESQSRDFVGVDVIYDGPCVTSDDKNDRKEYQITPFSTDLAYMMSAPDAISDQGFALVATRLVDGVYNAIIGDGVLSGYVILNAPLATSNLQDVFWRHDRFLRQGSMNTLDEVFDDIKPNIEQVGVSVKMCCEVISFPASGSVTTPLGEELGDIPGYVIKLDWDDKENIARMVLRYPY